MIIWNGNRRIDTEDPTTLPIGTLFRPDGSAIALYRDNIAEAYSEAVGPPPQPPALLGGGQMIPTYGTIASGVEVGYTYDPGPAATDATAVEEYKAVVEAWTAHAQAQKAIIDLFLEQLKR